MTAEVISAEISHHLQAAEFLYEARLFPELEYTFKHALTPRGRLREPLARATRGRCTDEFWKRWSAGSRTNPATRLRVWPVTLSAPRRGTRRPDTFGRLHDGQPLDLRTDPRWSYSIKRFRHSSGCRRRRNARTGHRHTPRPACRTHTLGRYDDVLTVMREAEILATRLGDRARLGRVLADICARLRNVAGEHRQAIEVGNRALAIAAETVTESSRSRLSTARARPTSPSATMVARSTCCRGARRARAEGVASLSPLFRPWSLTWLALTLTSSGAIRRRAITSLAGAESRGRR